MLLGVLCLHLVPNVFGEAVLISAHEDGAPATADSGTYGAAENWVTSPVLNDGTVFFVSKGFDDLSNLQGDVGDLDLFMVEGGAEEAPVVALSPLSSEDFAGLAAAPDFVVAAREYGTPPDHKRSLEFLSNTVLNGWTAPTDFSVDSLDWFVDLDVEAGGDRGNVVFAGAETGTTARNVFLQAFSYDLDEGFVLDGQAIKLTAELEDAYACTVSSDGRRVAFLGERDNGESRLFLWDSETGLIPLANDVESPQISSDGESIVYCAAGDNTLMTLDISTGSLRPVQLWQEDAFGDPELTSLSGRTPALSRSGRFLAWAGKEAGGIESEYRQIFLMDRVTRRLECVSVAATGDTADGHCVGPDISPDGMHVTFASKAVNLSEDVQGEDPPYQVYRAQPTFDASTPYWASHAAKNSAPLFNSDKFALSSDGAWVAFSSLRDNSTHLDLFNTRSGSLIESVYSAEGFSSITSAFSEDRQWLYVLEGGTLSRHRIDSLLDEGEVQTVVESDVQSFGLDVQGNLVYLTTSGEVRVGAEAEQTFGENATAAALSSRGNCMAFIEDSEVHCRFRRWDSASQTLRFLPFTTLSEIGDDPVGLAVSGEGRYVAVDAANGVEVFDLFSEPAQRILSLNDAKYPEFAGGGGILYVSVPPESLGGDPPNNTIPQGYLIRVSDGTVLKCLTELADGGYSDAPSFRGEAAFQQESGTWHSAVTTETVLNSMDMDGSGRDVYGWEGVLPEAGEPPWIEGKDFVDEDAILEDDTAVFFPVFGDEDQRDAERLRLEVDRQPEHGRLVTAPDGLPPVTYIPDPNYNGTDSFALICVDPQGQESAAAEFNMEVLPVDDPPVWLNDDLNVRINVDSQNEIDLRSFAYDPDTEDSTDPDVLTFRILSSTADVAIAADGHTLQIHAETGQDISVKLAVSDDGFATEVPMSEDETLAVDVRLRRTITLHSGWNLVSFPVEPTQESVESLLAEIRGPLWTWHETEGYKRIVADPESEQYLEGVGIQRGYWAYVQQALTDPVEVEVEGDVPLSLAPATVPSGWALAAPAGHLDSRPAPILPLGAAILQWNAQTQRYQTVSPWDGEHIESGQAYWIQNEDENDLSVDLRLK